MALNYVVKVKKKTHNKTNKQSKTQLLLVHDPIYLQDNSAIFTIDFMMIRVVIKYEVLQHGFHLLPSKFY